MAKNWQKPYIDGIELRKQEFLVVEEDSKILEELHLYWKDKDQDQADGKNRAYLSAFRIHPSYRERGLGTKLINRVFKRIKENGFTEVTIGAYKHEPEMQDLYKKWGFSKFVKEGIEETTEGKPEFVLLMKKL